MRGGERRWPADEDELELELLALLAVSKLENEERNGELGSGLIGGSWLEVGVSPPDGMSKDLFHKVQSAART